MATHSSYLAYKRDTRNLVYWMIHTSNAVIKSLPAIEDGSSTPIGLNTSGQINVAGLVAMAELIGKHIKSVPNAIFQLLRSVIVARSAHHAEFQKFAAAKPDADVEKSNVTHKFFIDALARAFKALGGDDWASGQKKPSNLDASDIDEVLRGRGNAPAAPQRRVQRKPGKGKKGKKGKKPKSKKNQKTPAAQKDELDGVPIESYRIIESDDALFTEYFMAVHSITKQWAELRDYLQGVWHDVAYKGLNSAVAGTLCNLATGIVKQTESDIFVDFPGHESYETWISPAYRMNACDILKELNLNFRLSLGESKFLHGGLDKIPPSHFSNTNVNGLWDYSPFLCGVGLMEALELAYRATMIVWEMLPEPTVMVDLHNMLRHTGYVRQPAQLFMILEEFFSEAFFAGGKRPTSNFNSALKDRVSKAKPVERGSKLLSRPSAHQTQDDHAGWCVDRIPDSALAPLSMMGATRISHTKYTTDPATGKMRYVDTELVRRYRERDGDDDELIRIMNNSASTIQKAKEAEEGMRSVMREFWQDQGPEFKAFSDAETAWGSRNLDDGPGLRFSGTDLLKAVRTDVHDDICGEKRPLSGLNFVTILNHMFYLLEQFDEELKRHGHREYVRECERGINGFERSSLLVKTGARGRGRGML
ncbi:hypothetical protein CMUS01_14928 [Colletotrichum musicola]|uniref:DUF6604 domain-containing protein n=1 Tax=Colletotrichum musicola TaxID=2175873 RepID=A0A8H6J100_9PEZI|nr:hypothetical protein CMUS01_14928 [Colletotrichum musicola]